MAKETVLRGPIKLKEISLTESLTDRILAWNPATGQLTDRPALSSSGFVTSSLPSAQILVGNNLGVATAVAVTGDVTISNLGVTAIGAGVIVNADINASAGIVYSKLTLTDGILNADINSAAGIVYSKLSLTNSIVNADVATAAAIARTKLASGNAYRVVVNNVSGVMSDATAITASRAIVSDANGIPVHATTTATQIGYLSTVTSNVQDQLDNLITTRAVNAIVKSPTGTEDGFAIIWDDGAQQYTLGDPVVQGIPTGGTTRQFLGKTSGTDYASAWLTLELSDVGDVTADIDDVNLLTGIYAAGVTTSVLTYLVGTTSAIQPQIDQKLSKTLSENYLFIGNTSNVAIAFAPGSEGEVLTTVGGVPTWTAPGSGGTVTSIDVSGGTTGLSFTGGPVTTTGTITASGTLALANGGTGNTLSDPNADRILFWDDSAGTVGWLTAGSGLVIDNTTISALLASTKAEYTGYTGGTVSTSIFDYTELTDGQSAKIIVEVLLTQTSGTPGTTAIGFKLYIVVRRASGTMTAVAASVQSEIYNDTGDSFSGTPSLTVGGGAVSLNLNLTTAKTFKRTYSILKYFS